MSHGGVEINVDFPIKKIEKKTIIDIRTFTPCTAKEVEEWCWPKMKNEKWIVHLQHNGKLSTWKIK